MVALSLIDPGTGAQVEQVTCVLRDDGAHTVPSTTWNFWYSNYQLSVLVGRASTGTGRMPNNNSDAHGIGIYWVYGAAWTL